MEKFSERLKELMFYCDNIKSESLAKAIGVAGSAVRAWCNGSRTIYLSNAIKLADFFTYSLDFLAGLTEERITVSPKVCPPFYKNLRKVMNEKGITRYYIGTHTQIKDSYFQKWKNGTDSQLDTIIYLAKQLDCSLDHLVGRED